MYHLCILFVLTGLNCGTQQDTNKNLLVHALRTYSGITIDGTLDELIWRATQPILLKKNHTSPYNADSIRQTLVRVCYDSLNLYISFECMDVDIWGTFDKRDQHLWTEEAVEVFVDVDNNENDYVEIEVSPKNTLFDSFIVDTLNIDVSATSKFNLPGIRTAVAVRGTLNHQHDNDSSWTVEISVPFRDLEAHFDKRKITDLTWKINFYRINRDDGKMAEYFAWSPTGGKFHRPSVFGTLKFTDR